VADFYRNVGGTHVESMSVYQTLTTSTTVDVPGSWVQMIASTARDATEIVLIMCRPDLAETTTVDIAFGGSGSEQLIASDFPFSIHFTENNFADMCRIPIQVPASTRIACRATNRIDNQADTIRCQMMLFAGSIESPPSYQTCDLIGRTVPDPGTTANTLGSYTQITSSLEATYKAIIVAADSNGIGAIAEQANYLNLSLGEASSEVDIIEYLRWKADVPSDSLYHVYYDALPLSLPEGERLACRSACSLTTADRLIRYSIWGVRGQRQPATVMAHRPVRLIQNTRLALSRLPVYTSCN